MIRTLLIEKLKNILYKVSTFVYKNRFLMPLFSAGVKIISKPEFNSFENNLHNLKIANEYLKNNGSVLIIVNHRLLIQHQLAMVKIIEKLKKKNKKATGVALTSRFRDDDKMDTAAKMLDLLLKSWGIEPVYFWREGVDSVELKKSNIKASKTVKEILKSKGGVFGLFPEGVASNELKEAKHGLWYFGKEAGLILLTTTYLNEDSSINFKIKIQKPIETKKIIETLNKNFIEKKTPQIFMDYLMAKLAITLPENEQGYYREVIKLLDNPNKNIVSERWNNLTQIWNELELID